ncbi:NAD(P)(+) transhydrogenase (Re/Si-specific) subunit beta [Cocleimonas sp. KMM 6892]|uniref:NAD(P)(+) transhydrogenase (Re/Si-specific) subunit beta n=1 Tax=unclassified Cocleimonas TaxID=2639732 RepID=UPI002DBCB72C|nr:MULTISPECIES: NAD(P)(+) transhydrogenase (Re/Si-specific) subunit beta [unclassified Cocleimonas]MEB8431143.1 NAD(P)(+) transhydrogenase (Re/Si-specific) subunit beta [Cocleimonas sp. KMM 6892]MEC4714085.1 NAD(P)(+) transhydrogenase (Re/Si-specific) subunit beta [Cocleimonas sp. KMM 6895]MEC4743416.1 NAD(P)(+) transhydrogenase (Re/Si-specific) subunit beta [Cocleimonas sp. KMM 6896]
MPDFIIQATYFLGALLFILGLKQMSSPVTARRGIVWAGVGMVLATLITYFHHEINHNYILMTVAIAIGGIIAFVSGKKVAMTDMPQMIALYNGMGGGAAAAIAAVVLIQQQPMSMTVQTLAVLGALIGTVAFSGSLIAFFKLQGILKGVIRFPMQQWINALVFVITLTFGLAIILSGTQYEMSSLAIFFVLALVFGVLMTVPIGGADMPVVISLYNALTGLAVGFEGFVLENPAMMIAGIVVGSAGTLLTQLMAKAMNRPITNVLFSNFGDGGEGEAAEVSGSMKEIDSTDVAVMMAFAEKVIVIPGYGMAVAQAQHKVWELTKQLQERGVNVKFAIHPVAGRMPGHMNVLLAEAGVPYDIIYDLDEINDEFATTDVVLVIGANDVVNPAARTDANSPIYGMPILNADYAKNVIVVKRGKGAGFSGIENHLFFADNTRMLYGDGQAVASELVSNIKEL